jgi:hypothetical protein
MKSPAGRIGWVLWAISMILTVCFVVIVLVHRGGPGPLDYENDFWFVPVLVLLFVSFSTIGAIIVSRRPENTIGWLFCASGIAMSGGFTAQVYAEYALFDNTSLPGGHAALWMSSWLPIFGLFVTPVYLLFLFPTGRPASRVWAVVVRVATCAVVVGLIGQMFRPGPIEPFSIDNPLGVSGPMSTALETVTLLFELSAILFFVLGAVSIVYRARRARGDERLQIRWFTYTASVMGLAFAISFISSALGNLWLGDIGFLVGAGALFALPVTCGLAILKYRLYDIDRVVNKTLVYGALTAVLVTGYAAGVLLMQSVLPLPENSEVAVAISTLAMAALFRPLRGRIQKLVDRRFYRARYDATHTIDSFGTTLRNETNLDSLASSLIGVVAGTVQPAHTSLWLKPVSGRERHD